MVDSPSTAPQGQLPWLLGTDGSKCAGPAATWTARNAPGRAPGIRVAAVWSIPTVAAPALMGAGPPIYDVAEIRTSTGRVVDETVDELRRELGDDEADIEVAGVVLEGSPAAALLDASEHASLLVLGSRGHGGFSRLVLGSTSTQCATHAIRPTVIVPTDAPVGEVGRIVVAVDGSEHSMEALRWAQRFATPECTIDCVTVRNIAPGIGGIDHFAGPVNRDSLRRWFDRIVDRADREEVARRDGAATPPLVRHLLDGDPRTELALKAEDGDLLVVGARGHGAVGAAILGSVSTWLLHHVQRPIVVVPGPSDDESGEPAEDDPTAS